VAGSSSAKARAKRRTIVVTMIKASLVGLIVPLLVVALSMLAAFLLKELNILIRATLMVLFGLAGLGLGTYVTLRILEEKVQPSLYSEEGENLRTPTRRAKRLRRGN
jgi:tellurite resistance protein TehA-like permease